MVNPVFNENKNYVLSKNQKTLFQYFRQLLQKKSHSRSQVMDLGTNEHHLIFNGNRLTHLNYPDDGYLVKSL